MSAGVRSGNYLFCGMLKYSHSTCNRAAHYRGEKNILCSKKHNQKRHFKHQTQKWRKWKSGGVLWLKLHLINHLTCCRQGPNSQVKFSGHSLASQQDGRISQQRFRKLIQRLRRHAGSGWKFGAQIREVTNG